MSGSAEDARFTDRLIARHIMNFTGDNPPRGRCVCGSREVCATCYWPNVLPYSTELEYANHVLGKLCKHHRGVVMESLAEETDGMRGWRVIVETRDGGDVEYADGSLPNAICLAALETIKIRDREETVAQLETDVADDDELESGYRRAMDSD